jgi:hypothetical protein
LLSAALALVVLRAASAFASVPVTSADLLAREELWPYHATLVRRWEPATGGKPVEVGVMGVLIRVEAGGLARIDFGRDGVHTVPVGDTDLVERANLVRTGALEKDAPNFALALGQRLLDASVDPPGPISLVEASHKQGFLCVFADPRAEGFPELADALRRLAKRSGVPTVLLPQGGPPDALVRDRLVALEWPVLFVPREMAEGYTRSLISDSEQLPAILLVTSQGRVLFHAPWSPSVLPGLESALASGFDRQNAGAGGVLERESGSR